MRRLKQPVFRSEADLCREFISALPDGWVSYAETSGFDILLVRASDGYQIGIEAKLKLNAGVVAQIVGNRWHSPTEPGPDFRAVLVPYGADNADLVTICDVLGITVIRVNHPDSLFRPVYKFSPALPETSRRQTWSSDWYDMAPSQRCALPEYVPDVVAGSKSPQQLTTWKIAAIRLQIIMERRGYVTRDDFKHLKLDHRRWIAPGYRWLQPGAERGTFIPGSYYPDLKAQHPVNYIEIAEDFQRWAPPVLLDAGLI